MRDATRGGVPIAVLAILAVATATQGGGCSDDGTSSSTESPSSSSGGIGGNGGGGGGSAGSGGTGGTPVVASINPASQDALSPFDAAPDPDGNTIYFTALDPTQGAGVFKVPAAGGASSALVVGDPFVAPFGIAVSSDGKQLYVADPASETGSADSDDAGQIFVLTTLGGNPTSLMGTAGLHPRGLDVADEEGVDVIYFSGSDTNGAGVFRIQASGGSATSVASGAPFVDPSSIVVAKNGDIYVADTVSSVTRQASILKIAKGSGKATEILGDLPVGYPAGISINMANTSLFVSGLDPATLTDVVIQIDLASMAKSYFVGDKTFDLTKFDEPAGLHRAKNKDVFGWADSKAKIDPKQAAAGTVFTITF